MSNFTFRLADRLGIVDRIYLRISTLINQHILSRNTVDMEGLADIYDALDGFWLRHHQSDNYNAAQVKVIIGSVIESLRNNHLSAAEVRVITNHVIEYWNPDKAVNKPGAKELIPERVEETALRAVKVYEEVGKPSDIADFVAVSSPMVSHALPVDRIAKTIGRFFR